jgi:hypothetical protein
MPLDAYNALSEHGVVGWTAAVRELNGWLKAVFTHRLAPGVNRLPTVAHVKAVDDGVTERAAALGS